MREAHDIGNAGDVLGIARLPDRASGRRRPDGEIHEQRAIRAEDDVEHGHAVSVGI